MSNVFENSHFFLNSCKKIVSGADNLEIPGGRVRGFAYE